MLRALMEKHVDYIKEPMDLSKLRNEHPKRESKGNARNQMHCNVSEESPCWAHQ